MPSVQYLRVKLSQLKVSDVKLREVQTDHPKYLDLKRSIAVHGVQHAILCRPFKDESGKLVPNTYQVADGWQRTNAAIETDQETVPIQVQMNMSDDDMAILQMILNEHRVPTSPKDRLDQYRKFIYSHPEFSQGEVATLFCIKDSDLSRILKLGSLSEQALELTNSGKIKASKAYALAFLPTEFQDREETLQKAMTMPADEFIAFCKSNRDAIAKEKRTGVKQEGPVLVYILRKKEEVRTRLDFEKKTLDNMNPEDKNYDHQSATVDVLQWMLSIDPSTIAEKTAAKKLQTDTIAAKKAADSLASAEKTVKELKERSSKAVEVAGV